MLVLAANLIPGKIIGQQIAGNISRLNENVPAICVLGSEIVDCGPGGINDPQPPLQIQNCCPEAEGKVSTQFLEDFLHESENLG
jgi:hypothetical protein